jgi:hypothetical protein
MTRYTITGALHVVTARTIEAADTRGTVVRIERPPIGLEELRTAVTSVALHGGV